MAFDPADPQMQPVPWIYTVQANGQSLATFLGDVNILGVTNISTPGYDLQSFFQAGDADWTPALTRAYAAIRAVGGGVLYAPSGVYTFSSSVNYSLPAPNTGIRLQGDQNGTTEFRFTANGGLGFIYNSETNSVSIRDITFTTTTVNTSTAITLFLSGTAPFGFATLNDIDHCVFRGADGFNQTQCWNVCILQNQVSYLNIVGCQFSGNTAKQSTGIEVEGAGGGRFAVLTNIIGCNFNYMQFGVLLGSYYQGLACVTTDFTSCIIGIYQPTGTVSNAEVSVSGCQFDCNNGIQLLTGASGTIVSSSYFIARSNNTCINIQGTYNFSFTGNYFESEAVANNTAFLIGAAGAAPHGAGVIAGNAFENFAAAIILQAGSNAVRVSDNVFDTCVAPVIQDLGSGNWIGPGQLPAVGSSGTVGASPATFTNGSLSATYYLKGLTGTVTQAGQTIVNNAAAGGGAISLQPGESITITWSGTAPTFSLITH